MQVNLKVKQLQFIFGSGARPGFTAPRQVGLGGEGSKESEVNTNSSSPPTHEGVASFLVPGPDFFHGHRPDLLSKPPLSVHPTIRLTADLNCCLRACNAPRIS